MLLPFIVIMEKDGQGLLLSRIYCIRDILRILKQQSNNIMRKDFLIHFTRLTFHVKSDISSIFKVFWIMER